MHTTTAPEIKKKKKRKYFKINTTDLLFWNHENTVELTLFKKKTTFMLTIIQLINSNYFGVNKKCCGLKPTDICAHLKVSHFYHSIHIFQRINFCHAFYCSETLIKDKGFVSSDNSRPTGLILIAFYNVSPCISYVHCLKLCKDHHIKHGALCKIINMEL
jgi:hypothetical protein